MLSIFVGDLTLLLGFSILLLPLLVTELSRPRDALWGAVVLFLGLIVLTSNERLSGPSMAAMFLGLLLIGRLSSEVAQSRWQQLSNEEKLRLGSIERWSTGIQQFGAMLAHLGVFFAGSIKNMFSFSTTNTTRKKWIRPETSKVKQESDQAFTNLNE